MKSLNISTTMDCNNCKHLSITEAEQQRDGTHPPHICTKYNQRVLHYTINKIHNEYIYPCDKCLKENNNETRRIC